VHVFACVGRAALRGHPRRRAVHARGAVVDLRAGTGTGVWGGSARSVRPSSGCTWTTREAAAHATCHQWRAAMRAASRSWDDGPDGAALCHGLFGVGVSEAHGAACVRFRCGQPRDAEGVALQFVDHPYCHWS